MSFTNTAMQTIASATTTINRVKAKLIAEAKKKGVSENFGQKETRQLLEQCHPFGTPEQRTINAMVMQFELWAMDYTG